MQGELASYIEHTNLKSDLTKVQVERLCQEAIQYDFAGICIPPYFVRAASYALRETEIGVVTVVGFPFGYHCTASKVEEAKKAINDGATELDMVANISAICEGDRSFLINDIQSVTTVTQMRGGKVKVILEVGLLNDDELRLICSVCEEIGVDYVKTCSGFGPRGVELNDVKTLRELLPNNIKIKASGGVNTSSFSKELIMVGADRIGTSSGVALMN